MKTLHLDTERAWRGGQQQLFYLLEGLQSRGVPAVLLAQPGSLLLERARAASLDARPFASRGEADLAAAWRLARLLRDEPFDLLHCHTAHAHGVALLARWLAPRERRPKLIVARRVIFPFHPWLRRDQQAKLSFPARFKYGRADRIVAVSQAIKSDLIRDGLEDARISVVHDGIDVEQIERAAKEPAEVRRSLGVQEAESMVVNVAHLSAEKGQFELLLAFPAVRDARRDVRLVLVGDGAERPKLERFARAPEFGNAVVFAGFRPPEEIPKILKAADVFVFPSREEGLGSTLFEAMAAGAPIVATRTGGIPEIVHDEETGLLVPRKSPRDLARAILRLLDDGALAQRLAAAAKQFVETHGTKQRMVEQTIHVYQELLGQKKAAGAAGGA
jgi:glycosyltransferase involved in cell wall biosynthesis